MKEQQEEKVVYFNQMAKELIEYTKGGSFRKGFKSGIPELDEMVLFTGGMLAVVTGHAGCGKSEIVDHLVLAWSKVNGFRTLYFSPENHPITEHGRKHVERFLRTPIHKVRIAELNRALTELDDKIAFIDLPEHEIASIGGLLKIAEAEMERRPFQVMVFDPWNECDFGGSDREDLHISRCITAIKKFLRAHDVLGILVAHPRTPREKVQDEQGRQDYPVPKMADISGGGIWRAKADWGIVCHRHPEDNMIRMQFQKVKYKSLGRIGEIRFDYEWQTGRFKSVDQPDFTLPGEDEEPPL